MTVLLQLASLYFSFVIKHSWMQTVCVQTKETQSWQLHWCEKKAIITLFLFCERWHHRLLVTFCLFESVWNVLIMLNHAEFIDPCAELEVIETGLKLFFFLNSISLFIQSFLLWLWGIDISLTLIIYMLYCTTAGSKPFLIIIPLRQPCTKKQKSISLSVHMCHSSFLPCVFM